MKKIKKVWAGSRLLILILTLAASPAAAGELLSFPVDDLEGVVDKGSVVLDAEVKGVNGACLRIDAPAPRVVPLFETGDLDVEKARLIYRARLKVKNLKGSAFLEMWCRFPAKGEYFSRGLANPLGGDSDWVEREIFFFLQAGQNPDNIKLNLVVNGTGTVWIDDISLSTGPLK